MYLFIEETHLICISVSIPYAPELKALSKDITVFSGAT